ncbi:p48 polypeptide of DNA primase [Mycoemilia scoparia]|uniref:DNA primase n=1 Tax=Mycoemilia scoparia TaxID=417184 RepID=A0A9W8DSS6_9FUNG|nr:p48 polypeptide of DNA primase [Mycoemilia scoparia]
MLVTLPLVTILVEEDRDSSQTNDERHCSEKGRLFFADNSSPILPAAVPVQDILSVAKLPGIGQVASTIRKRMMSMALHKYLLTTDQVAALDPTKSFTHREFSFTIDNDVYIRYQSFKDCDEMKQEIIRMRPNKIDIGAIFTVQPKHAKMVQPGAFKPLEKELVFDIDMTDYDEIRTCCSGRRGVHCWVCDEQARCLDDAERKAIINYLTLIKGGSQQSKKVILNGNEEIHPHISRSLEIAYEHFDEIVLRDQGILDTEEQWSKLLSLIPDEDTRDTIDKIWQEDKTDSSFMKWEEFEDTLEKKMSKRGSNKQLEFTQKEIVLQYLYPRLDENVTTHLNHLLKSPFCVHPKTGRVCTPISPDDFETFDPFKVPTVVELLDEINSFEDQGADSQASTPDDHNAEPPRHASRLLPDYKKTSLKPYIETFEQFVAGIKKAAVKQDPLAF